MDIPRLIMTGREETFLTVTPILFDWTIVVACTSGATNSSSGNQDSSGLSTNRSYKKEQQGISEFHKP